MKAPKYYRKYGYRLSLLPNDYLASLEEGVNSIESALKKTGFSIGYPGWGLIYYLILCHLKPDNENIIIETGTNWGSTTIVLGQALKDSGYKGKVYTIEIDPANHKKALYNLNAAMLEDYVCLIKGDSRLELPRIMSEFDEIRVAFLDGSHLYDDVIFEFDIIYPLLTEQSIVIFDNTYQIAEEHEDQRVNGALRYIQKRYGGNIINLEYVSWYTPGIAIWQKSPF